MSADLVAFYERILTLVPVDELQDTAAFAKLKEVRDAVNKLSNASTGRESATLIKELNATLKLQLELERKLELLMTQLSVVEREQNLSNVLSQLEKLLIGLTEDGTTLKYVIFWAHFSAEQGQTLEPFRAFHEAMKIIIEQQCENKNGKTGHKRLNNSLFTLLQDNDKGTNEGVNVANGKSCLNLDMLVFWNNDGE
ncbi:LOW QUALITY PROTEIN: hypothetical protein PHMEG_00025872 [Phytophthora megakarya]|uniref:Uncharacterized protein n=1 Tax=Phytophthora megakarya TaxID=4795 RepID=A0A225VCF5_9STRA|nr:LOW QUALITY PROTEIN: hypothetical protein PHMEG_00025872 [Phytophthora megakarya]